jgi:magnesium transporter
MNFKHMPDLEWVYGYPLAIGLMVSVCGVLYSRFRAARWI